MKHLLYILLIAILTTSCERVIDIDLKSVEKKYVIEGNVTNEPGATTTVSITQTKDFVEDNNFPGIIGATVTISDNGNVVTLTETSAGVYTTKAIQGTVGHTYALKVLIGDREFSATSTMPV